MMQVDIHEAKTRFSDLVEMVAKGESIVITKAGKPVAKLIPYEAHETNRCGYMAVEINNSKRQGG